MTKRLSNSPESFLPLTPVAFEILLALAEGERHGYEVMIEIERRSAGRISPNPGTLYRALDRLVQEGLLTSAVRSVEGESRRGFFLSPLRQAVAAARSARAERVQRRGCGGCSSHSGTFGQEPSGGVSAPGARHEGPCFLHFRSND